MIEPSAGKNQMKRHGSRIWYHWPMSENIHVTVAAIIERQGRFLLVEEMEQGNLVLNQPAGHLETGESLIQAVIREVREESGHSFLPQGLVGIYRLALKSGHTFIRFCFYGQIEADTPSQPEDAEILACHWLSTDEICARIKSHRSPLVMQCLDEYLAGRRFSLELLSDVLV